ncbi:MAG: threonine--tRNA ligase [Patescibacteria group bacterium]|nr:threonine--tRNA ligase [Patescibacteria group bacterium]
MTKKTNNPEVLNASATQILAVAVLKLFPQAKIATGQVSSVGFFYDFELPESLTPENLPAIEKEMRKLINKDYHFEQQELALSEAKEIFAKNKQPYQLELLEEMKQEGQEKIKLCQSENLTSISIGDCLSSAREIAPDGIKLVEISGAYWKGDKKKKMLQRIYGVAFKSKLELKKYLAMTRLAKERDHRKLGKELDLFVSSPLVGKGLPLLTPKGTAIRQELEKFIIEEEEKRGYQRVSTPDLAKVDLYKKSGHWDHYQEDMYPPINIDGQDYVLRPMACPHHFILYKSKPRSYRDLPIRYAELAKLYRKEQSGELSGLIRMMSFTLADAHLICRPDQVEEEFKKVLELVQHVMRTLKITDYWYRFSKWDPKDKKKYVDKPKEWEKTQKLMEVILKKLKLDYVQADGEAAFYGPKLDVQTKNVYGKEETAFTIQIDFDLPEKFDLTFVDEQGEKQRPIVIHRSSIGCIERTLAFLIEQTAGSFPVWLSPVQAVVIPISEKFNNYGKSVMETLQKDRLRVEIDNSDESLGKKISQARQQKIPYLLIVGEKEANTKEVAVRSRAKGDEGAVKLEDFIKRIRREIKERQ